LPFSKHPFQPLDEKRATRGFASAWSPVTFVSFMGRAVQWKETRFHVAGQKLQLLAFFYWLTRDAVTIRALEPQWRPSVDLPAMAPASH
jgi:hypothetical protein